MSAAPPAPPVYPELDNSVGAFLVGTIFSVYLAGVTSVQAFEYYEQFWRKDRKWIVGTVSFLLVIDLFHTAITCYTIYLWTVTHYGDLSALVQSPWTFTWDPFLTGLVALVVQSFYAYRVYIVSQRKWFLPVVISILSLLQFTFATVGTWKIYDLNREFARFDEFRYGVAIWLLSAAMADILITGSLIYYLRKVSSEAHQQSASIVRRICYVAVETNGLTCLIAIADAILFVAMPKESWHVIPNFSLVKLYYNGLLASLNCRRDFSSSPRSQAYSEGTHGTPAPKYSSPQITSSGPSPNPNLITPQTLDNNYASKARGLFDSFINRSGGGSRKSCPCSADGTVANGVCVTTVHDETTSGSSSHEGMELEKALDPASAQTFQLATVQHPPGSEAAAVTIPVQVIPAIPARAANPAVHPYAASASHTSVIQQQQQQERQALSMRMAGAIPREWA